MCYSDLPYLYTGRGFAELNWPYTDDAQVRARYEAMEYPVGISYWRLGHRLGHPLADRARPTSTPRYGQPADDARRRSPRWPREMRLYVVVNAVGLALLALLAAWLLAGSHRAGPGTPRCSRSRRRCC